MIQSLTRSLRIAYAPFAHPDAPMGYGVIGNKIREGLAEAGATLLSSTAFGWDCVLAISLPAAWPSNGAGKRGDLVWHTMFEMEPLPPAWADVLNRSAGVWVPSPWCKELFEAHGVTIPVFSTGYGVDRRIFFPSDRTSSDDRPLRVGAWGQAFIGRKNVLMAARAFMAAGFPVDQALLEIKLNAKQSQERMKGPNGDFIPNVHIISEDWPASRVGDWLRSLDVLIYLSGGEGFGLMPFEAMACGVTVICAYNTGMMSFLTPETALLVPSEAEKKKNVGYSLRFGVDCYEHAPSFEATVEHLRWCFNYRREALALGQRAAAALAHQTWKHTGEEALANLCQFY